MRRIAGRLASAGLALFTLGGCDIGNSVGYVEIKTAPFPLAAALYLDTTKLDPPRNGMAVLRQRTGTAKLQTEGEAGRMAVLCNIVVQKNRITSVTISLVSRQLRCQCGRNGGPDTMAGRMCIA